ncbi:hypothetical protein [Butyrivibrio sp. AC2005]|uniref:hypothetical protein n=1 Tax=Butyrivibrio sp. AC2005 TaxID=1280672 RepID=UPI0003F7FFD3|nr:hypothetical protein [Butyrivibrio sp. AC2005]
MKKFMSGEECAVCIKWIKQNLSGMTRKQADSYVLKHIFQRMTGIYSTDEEFQEMMKICGYEPIEQTKSLFEVKVDSVVIKNYYR